MKARQGIPPDSCQTGLSRSSSGRPRPVASRALQGQQRLCIRDQASVGGQSRSKKALRGGLRQVKDANSVKDHEGQRKPEAESIKGLAHFADAATAQKQAGESQDEGPE